MLRYAQSSFLQGSAGRRSPTFPAQEGNVNKGRERKRKAMAWAIILVVGFCFFWGTREAPSPFWQGALLKTSKGLYRVVSVGEPRCMYYQEIVGSCPQALPAVLEKCDGSKDTYDLTTPGLRPRTTLYPWRSLVHNDSHDKMFQRACNKAL